MLAASSIMVEQDIQHGTVFARSVLKPTTLLKYTAILVETLPRRNLYRQQSVMIQVPSHGKMMR